MIIKTEIKRNFSSIFLRKIEFSCQSKRQATLTNALAVICILKEFGFTNEKIVEKINNLKAVEMRLESVNGVRNNLIINDSFNLDLDSLIIAYQFINQYNRDEKTLVLSDIFDVKMMMFHFIIKWQKLPISKISKQIF